MKKSNLLVAVAALALTFGVASCGGDKSSSSSSSSTTDIEDVADSVKDAIDSAKSAYEGVVDEATKAIDEASSTTEEKEEASSSSSESASTSFGEYLKEYEEFVDKTIELSKKAKDGDASAIAEYTDLLQKAQSTGNKIEGLKNDISASDWVRYARIQAKLIKASAEAHF